MPIYRRDDQKIHFIHIPKTGGMSIRHALESAGWTNVHKDQKGSLKIGNNNTYHGHMPYAHWKDWNAVKECSFEFAFTRNPIDRMRSLVEMHLRSFLGVMKDRAWSSGGGNTPEMRDFLIDVGILPSEGFTEAQVISGIFNIVVPNDPEVVQMIAEQNGVSRKEYVQQIAKNQHYVSQQFAIREVEKYFGRDLKWVTWMDLLRMYFDQNNIQNHERNGVSPCPVNKYLSPNTHIYQFESIEQAFDDLTKRGIVNEKSCVHHNRTCRLLPVLQPSAWDDDPSTRDTFFDVYGPDFEQFDYDRSTPFPEQRNH